MNRRNVEKKAWLYDTNDLPPVIDEDQQIEELFNTGKEILSQKLLHRNNVHTSQDELAQLLCECIKRKL